MYGLISESFALIWNVFMALTKKNCCFHCNVDLKQNAAFNLVKLIEYFASAITTVSSNPCVWPSPRTKIYFFLLSICNDELLSTQKIIALLPQSKFGNEKSERELNSTLYPESRYLT